MKSSKIALFAIPALVVLLGISVLATSFSSVSEIQASQTSFPKLNEKTAVTGWVTLTVFDEFGNVKQKVENRNLVVDGGIDEMAQAIFGVGGVGTTFFNYIEIGIGTTATTPTTTAIETPIGGCARVQDASPDVNSAISGETHVSVISSFAGSSCTGAVTEAGIFNTLTTGQLLARSTFGAVTIGSGDTLNVNYTITLT